MNDETSNVLAATESRVSKALGLKELAERINAHLKRFEADPVINAGDPTYKTPPYYSAGASYYRGPKLSVRYVAYQHSTKMSKADAAKYLAWLDAGNVGTHYHAERALTRRALPAPDSRPVSPGHPQERKPA